MRIKKKFLVAFFITISVIINAQSVGVKGGLNLSTVSTNSVSGDISLKPGFNFSVFYEHELIDMLSIRPGLGFEQKGYITEQYDIERKLNINYLQMDVDILITMPESNIPVYFILGPYIDYAVSGTYKFSSTSYDIDFDNSNYDPNDFGFSFGVGYKFDYSEYKFFTELKYDIGIPDILDGSGYIRNQNLELSLGVIIGL